MQRQWDIKYNKPDIRGFKFGKNTYNFSRTTATSSTARRSPRFTVRTARMLLLRMCVESRVRQVGFVAVLALKIPALVVVFWPTWLLFITSSIPVVVILRLLLAHLLLSVMMTDVILTLTVLGTRSRGLIDPLLVLAWVLRRLIICSLRLLVLIVHLLLHIHVSMHLLTILLIEVRVVTSSGLALISVHCTVSLWRHVEF